MVKTVSDLNAEIDAQFADNHSRSITPAKQRTVLKDIVTNIPVTASQVIATSGTPSSSTFLRGDNTWNAPVVTATDIETISGTPDSTTILYGDNTWKTAPTGGGGGTITIAGGSPVFQTYADARTAVLAGSIDLSIHTFSTNGFYHAGDNGRSVYVDMGSSDLTQPGTDNAYRTSLVVGEPAVLHDGVNGRYFLMMPRGSEIWVEQFGAQNSGWLVAINDLTPFLYKAQRYIRKVARIAGGQIGVSNIRIGTGSWFLDSCFNIKGGSLNIYGTAGNDSTTLHPSNGHTGICICAEWNFDGDTWWGPFANTAFALSDSFGTGRQGRIAVNGNVYELTVAGTTAVGSTGPTGTGSDIVDGTTHWKYIRPVLPDEGRSGSGGGGSVIDGISIFGFFNPTTDTFGLGCGILGVERGLIRGCLGDSVSGHGIAFMANGDPSFPYASGNCNGWKIEDCTCYYNGWSGFRVGYSDGNAGHGIGLDTAYNGWFGVDDHTFLIASWHDVQSANDGRGDNGIKKHPGAVTYAGNQYVARIPIGGIEGALPYSTQTPGTGSAWVITDNSGTATPSTNHPTWVSGTVYEPGGAFAGHDNNSRSIWTGVYVEGGTMPCQFAPRHTVLGAIMNGDALLDEAHRQGVILMDQAILGTLEISKLNIGDPGGPIRIYAAADITLVTGYFPPGSIVFKSNYSGTGVKAWITYAGGDPATFVTYL